MQEIRRAGSISTSSQLVIFRAACGRVSLSLHSQVFGVSLNGFMPSSLGVHSARSPITRQEWFVFYFPDFGDSAGFAVAPPLGCNWNSFLIVESTPVFP